MNLNTSQFIDSISEFDNSYQKFYNNHIPSYKEYYVESRDDAEFYSYYLANLYRVSRLSKIYGCNGKKEVLSEYRRYTGKKAGFIVDSDYVPLDKVKYDRVIVTTGYSMENFFFFKTSDFFNFQIVFEEYYPKASNRKKVLEEYLLELEKFKKKNLLYFAYFKTCMEFFKNRNISNSHVKIKQVVNTSDNIKELIDKEISFLEDNIREKFISKYEKNIDYLTNTDYMMIRGHDVFDHLIDFLKRKGKFVKIADIMKLSSKMKVPDDFLKQINRE